MRHCHTWTQPVTPFSPISLYFLFTAGALGRVKPCRFGAQLVRKQLSNCFWLRTRELHVWKLHSTIAMSVMLFTINAGCSCSQWPTNELQDGAVVSCIRGWMVLSLPYGLQLWVCEIMGGRHPPLGRWKLCNLQMMFDKLLGWKGKAGGVTSFIFHVAAVSDKIAVGFMYQDPFCHCPGRNTSWDKQQCQQNMCVELSISA